MRAAYLPIDILVRHRLWCEEFDRQSGPLQGAKSVSRSWVFDQCLEDSDHASWDNRWSELQWLSRRRGVNQWSHAAPLPNLSKVKPGFKLKRRTGPGH